jgi:hypothetical protein
LNTNEEASDITNPLKEDKDVISLGSLKQGASKPVILMIVLSAATTTDCAFMEQ